MSDREKDFDLRVYGKSGSNVVKIRFAKKQTFTDVCRLVFCSKLLHSLAPNEEGIWTETQKPRVNANIKGFPKNVDWSSPEDLLLEGVSTGEIDTGSICDAIEAIKGKKK